MKVLIKNPDKDLRFKRWIRKGPPPGSPPGTYADETAAQRIVSFFQDELTHIKGEWAGTPILLDEWEAEEILCPIFGWKRPDGLRLIRTAYVEIPRKNGKSTIAAGIGNYLTFADHEPGAEVYSAAADKEQAAIVFDTAKLQVEGSQNLRSRSIVLRRSISINATNSFYKVLSADVKTKHGLNGHGIIFDELHTQPNRDLYDVLVSCVGSRRQPLVFFITTAGFDRQSVCWEVHEYASKILSGAVKDPSFWAVIYSLDEKASWSNEKNWYKVNPGLGKSVKLDYLRGEAAKAKEIPAYENTFRRLHLDQWTQQATRWLQMSVWERCRAKPLPLLKLKGRECFGGLDLSSTTDLAAWCLLFPPVEDGEFWDVHWRLWLPEANLKQRIHKDRVPYDAWIRDGYIDTTEGDLIDYDVIRAALVADASAYNIREAAFDRWGAVQLSTQLTGDGLTMVPFGQGFASMSAPTKELMNKLLGGRLRHGNHPVATWAASNVSVRQDPAGNIKPDRDTSGGRIDPIGSLIMALGRATVNESSRSRYEDEGLMVLE